MNEPGATSTTPTSTPPRPSLPHTYTHHSPTRIPRPSPPRAHRLSPSQLFRESPARKQVQHPPSPPETVRSASPVAGWGSAGREEARGETGRRSFPTSALRGLAGEGGLRKSGASGGTRARRDTLGFGAGDGSSSAMGAASERPREHQKPKKRCLVHVIPPALLPHSPPPAAISGFARGYGPSGRYASGILLPLQPTLGAQLALIAREYSLPSVGGVSLYLCLPSAVAIPTAPGFPFPSREAFKPRLLEESWSMLWGDGDHGPHSLSDSNGLPIAARIEFDIDPRKARWLPAWMAGQSTLPVPSPPVSSTSPIRRTRPRASISYNHSYSPTPENGHSSSSSLESMRDLRHSRASSVASSAADEDDTASFVVPSAVPYPLSRSPSTSSAAHTPPRAPPPPPKRGCRPLSLLISRTIPSPAHPHRTAPRVTSPAMGSTFGPLVESPVKSSKERQREVEITAQKLEQGSAEPATPAATPTTASAPTPRSLERPFGFEAAHVSLVSSDVAVFSAEARPPSPSPPSSLASEGSAASQLPGFTTPDLGIEMRPTWEVAGTPMPSRVLGSAEEAPASTFDEAQDQVLQAAQLGISATTERESSFDVLSPGPSCLDEDVGPPQPLARAQPTLSYPFNLANIYSSIYPRSSLYPSLQLSLPPRRDLSPTLPLPSYPSFATLYPPVYPHISIYPSLALPASAKSPAPPRRLVSSLSIRRKAPIPAPLVLLQRTGSARRTPSLISTKTVTPSSPDRLPSVSLEERLALSASAPVGAREVASRAPEGALAGEEGRQERDRDLVQRDWDVKVVSLREFEAEVQRESAEMSPTAMVMGEYEEYERGEQEDMDAGGMFGELLQDEERPAKEFLSVHGGAECYPPPLFALSTHLAPPHSPSGLSASLPSPTLNAAALNRHSLSRTSAPASLESSLGALDPEEASFLLPPRLGEALGLDSPTRESSEERSSELEETMFPDDGESGDEYDENVLEERGYPFEDEEGEGEAVSEGEWTGEQYLALDESFGAGEDQSCMTFDHLSPLPVDLPPPPVLFTFPPTDTSDDLPAALGQFIIEAQTQSILRRGRFTVALDSGSSPEILAEALLGDERVDWRKWEVFFTDERLGSRDHPDSTFAAYDKLVFSRVRLPAWQIHSPSLQLEAPVSEKLADEAAADYEAQLMKCFPESNVAAEPPRFDLILLGMGADGHCASLYPTHPLLDEHDFWVCPFNPTPSSTSPQAARLTFTLSLLSAARRLAFVTTGADKSLALGNALDTGLALDDEEKVPAGRVTLVGHPVVWFVDEGAAAGVKFPRSEFWEGEDEE